LGFFDRINKQKTYEKQHLNPDTWICIELLMLENLRNGSLMVNPMGSESVSKSPKKNKSKEFWEEGPNMQKHMSHEKKNLYTTFHPSYWLFNGDHYNGLLKSLYITG